MDFMEPPNGTRLTAEDKWWIGLVEANMSEIKRKRKPGKSARAPKTARQMLDKIDRFLLTAGSEESSKLWNVMAALRGPDDDTGDSYLKGRTTVPIRKAAFPRVNASGRSRHVTNGATFWGETAVDIAADEVGHFFTHVRDAARSLKEMEK